MAVYKSLPISSLNQCISAFNVHWITWGSCVNIEILIHKVWGSWVSTYLMCQESYLKLQRPGAESANLFFKGPDNNYFRICRLSFFLCLQLLNLQGKVHIDYMQKNRSDYVPINDYLQKQALDCTWTTSSVCQLLA